MTGTRIAIAAPRDNRNAPNAGSAYLYEPANLADAPGVLNHPGLSFGNGFGRRVAISGSRLVASGHYGTLGGSILVHDLASATPGIPVVVIENPTPDYSDWFEVVAISGSKLVVGAYADSNDGAASGCAYVFDLDGANPGTPLVTLHNPAPDPGDSFGGTVAIEGNRVLVSATGEDEGVAPPRAEPAARADVDGGDRGDVGGEQRGHR